MNTLCSRILRALLPVLAVAVIAGAPQRAAGHGELLIQISRVTRKIEVSTNNAQLYLERGELYREDKNWPAAEADYTRAARLGAKIPDVDFCRAKMLADSGRLDTARETFTKVIGMEPKCGDAFIERARVLVRLGERDSAVADFRRGVELVSAPRAEHFLELAQVLTAKTEFSEAVHSLDDGMKKLGPVAMLQTSAFELELKRENTNAALARLDAIIEQAERKETWLARRGDILLALNRISEARDSYEAAIAAIGTLPRRLQELSHTAKLKTRLGVAVAEITARMLAQKTDGRKLSLLFAEPDTDH